jgi:hypothetical protein
MLGATQSELALLKRLSVGFSLEPDERSDRVVRALNGAADKIESSSTTS